MVEIAEFDDDEDTDDSTVEAQTHGYEGTFKVGDKVRVTKSMRIWSVKPYTKEGFDPKGFEGQVIALVLYGRKFQTLCSAITPIKVEFQPDSPGIPADMFQRKWSAHFEHTELELIM